MTALKLCIPDLLIRDDSAENKQALRAIPSALADLLA